MDGLNTSPAPAATTRASVSSGLLGRAAGLVAFSLVFTFVGSFVAHRFGVGPATFWVATLVALGCSLALGRLREVPIVNLGLLYTLAFSLGLTIGPALDRYVRAGYSDLVYRAAGLTAALTLMLSVYALTTGRDFARLEDYLYFALLGLVLVGAGSLFLRIPQLHLAIGLVGALIFSLFVVVDLRRARSLDDTMGNAVLLAVDLYLDILNLFLYLLRLLAGASGDD